MTFPQRAQENESKLAPPGGQVRPIKITMNSRPIYFLTKSTKWPLKTTQTKVKISLKIKF